MKPPVGLTTTDLPESKHPWSRTPEEWEAYAQAQGDPAFRGRQAFHWIHRRGVLDPENMTNLSKGFRQKLAELMEPLIEVPQVHRSEDSTRKLLIRTHDDKDVETVLIPQLRNLEEDEVEGLEVAPGRVAGQRITQCISSQVGCAMGCVFCASGIAGLKRHLTAAEIVGQILVAREHLTEGEALRNVVFMGMGEPLHNYAQVKRALVLLTHPDGIGLSTRRVTVSTSGLVPQIDAMAKDFGGQVQLAISLHAVTDEQRSSIMPINRKHSLGDLVACLKRYPLPKRRRITIEYTLIRGVNDSDAEARGLVKLLKGIPIKVNLIPMNPVPDSPLGAPDMESVDRFQSVLRDLRVNAFIRTQRGDSIAAACGQLALHGEKRKVKMRLPTVREA